MTQQLSVEAQHQLKLAATNLQRDFRGVFAAETIEQFLTTSYEEFAGARITSFIPLLAERFARQRLRALAKLEGHGDLDGVPVVLFLCTHNAGRSQMAMGWFTHFAGERAVAWSGGSEPASAVNPAAVQAMAEVGIDISQEYPKPWTDEVVRAADVVITMGCGDACPIFPGKRYEDWELEDPAGKGVEAVRPIRDEIAERVKALLATLEVPVS